MKRLISLIIGIIVISGIFIMTIYTLTHKNIRANITNQKSAPIELVNSSFNNNELSELYNVILNEKKHKIKFLYNIILPKDSTIATLELYVYFDGGNIIHEIISSNIACDNASALELFKQENINDLKINLALDNIVLLNNEEYVLLQVNYDNTNKYFIFNDSGDLLINKGLTITSNEHYISNDNISIYYNDNYLMTKYENDAIYNLEVTKNKDKITITEYKYYFKDNKFIKEKLNTYQNLKIAK